MPDTIVNKVAQSALVSFDLEELYPIGERVLYDLKHNLFQGVAIKEKEFRSFIVATNDWSAYRGKFVAITCSVDAIIPTWAYMLLVSELQGHAKHVVVGDLNDLENALFQEELNKLDIKQFEGKKVVLKGCSSKPVPEYAFAEITRKLLPIVSSLMFGEPCSTVPVFKKQKNIRQD